MAQAKKAVKPTRKRRVTYSRPSLFDYVEEAERETTLNKFCEKKVLKGEASVEQFFVSRLLEDLDYKDTEIRPKSVLQVISVAKGRRKENYRPDYVIQTDNPRWLIDAKAPDESVDFWAYQGAGYALGLNKQFKGQNPVQYYVITNGLELKVWKWDESEPVLELAFADFFDDHQKYLALKALLSAPVVRQGWAKETKPETVLLKKPTVEQMKRVFKRCHDIIYKAAKLNPQPAFFEFVKIMVVKLLQDKKLHSDPELGPLLRKGWPIPRDAVIFSKHWIEALEKQGVESPVDTVLFKNLLETLKEAVLKGDKKPIFGDDERIDLQAGTIKQVVGKLEMLDMFGIDEDLNGRLFETFLSATMRGKDLGQYFTPRSIVKLIERLAGPVVTRNRVDRVLDACCGTGGFLIEVLTDMRNQIRNNTSLTQAEANKLHDQVANESIFGIDAGREPPLARIARINMYLHGDGGSKIYAADSLDKSTSMPMDHSQQTKRELDELRELIEPIRTDPRRGFDIALSNPPFSMGYSDVVPNEQEILDQYDLTRFGFEGTARHRGSLRSNIMFIERYADLLRPLGHLITVIDDSILASPKNSYARNFIRSRFIVRAVISLPGDAFHRVGARVKTSILYLTKRGPEDTGQGDVFMYECKFVGLDDVPMKTRPSVAQEARRQAEQEVDEIIKAFGSFLAGRKGPWLVPAELITGRLDVKACLPRLRDITDDWTKNKLEVVNLGSIVDPITEGGLNPQDKPEQVFTMLRVRYDGIPEEGEKALGKEITYKNVLRPQKNDVVAGNINMVQGSVAVIPDDLTHTIASSEFTIMRLKDRRFNAWFLWAFLRSAEVRARLLSNSTGLGRHRIDWGLLSILPVPVLDKNTQRRFGEQLRKTIERAREAEKERESAIDEVSTLLNLDNEWAVNRLKAAKPPK
jgi:type I restriction enzyme M protein